jgi:uncharacterized protein YprB with RNaseH-like and TPR domain
MARSLLERLQALEQSVGRRRALDEVAPPPPDGERAEAAESSGSGQPPGFGEAAGSARSLGFAGFPGTERAPESEEPLLALGFQRIERDGTHCWVRVLRYDLLTVHGPARFGDLLTTDLHALFRAVREQVVDAENLRFYDTETTGLGTGAGTIPFLHAVGQFEGDEFAVYQYFLSDYGEEAAMLVQMVAAHFADGGAVVTFNGKSFDWPLLKNRLRLYRQPVPEISHLDLVYPSRRLWKRNLERVSLGAVEQHILGLERVDDLPGREAPNRYFAYVESRDADLIAPVLDHNATDVCSLVVLAHVLAETLNGRRSREWAGERLAVGRYYDEWQEFDLAEQCYVTALECPDAHWREHWLYSLYLKRRERWEQAVQVWEDMDGRFAWSVQPAVELAKYYEHRVRDLAAARRWTEHALERAQEQQYLRRRLAVDQRDDESDDDPVVVALQHRLNRILRKSGQGNLASF